MLTAFPDCKEQILSMINKKDEVWKSNKEMRNSMKNNDYIKGIKIGFNLL